MQKRPKKPNRPKFVMATERAHGLIDGLLREMQEVIKTPEPENVSKKHWERLFGAKDSMVINLQKLVQSLVALPNDDLRKTTMLTACQEGRDLTRDETDILLEWLHEQAERA